MTRTIVTRLLAGAAFGALALAFAAAPVFLSPDGGAAWANGSHPGESGPHSGGAPDGSGNGNPGKSGPGNS